MSVGWSTNQDVDGRNGPGHDKDQFQAIFLKAIFTWSGVNSRPDRP